MVTREPSVTANEAAVRIDWLQEIVDAAFPTGGTEGPNAWTDERIRVRTRFAEQAERIINAALRTERRTERLRVVEQVRALERAASHAIQAWHRDVPEGAPNLHRAVAELEAALDAVAGLTGEEPSE